MATVMAVGVAAAACTPTFDWREVRPDPVLLAMFPCKPEQHTRRVDVQGVSLAMTLASCNAGEYTFALSYLDAPDITRLAPLMQALQAILGANVAVTPAVQAAAAEVPASVPGATPHALARRLALAGQRPDGQPVQAQAQFFCRGLRIYQATVIGRRLDAQALEPFFSSLTLSS